MLIFNPSCFVLMFILVVQIPAISTETQSDLSDIELMSSYYEGDMILNTEQQQQLKNFNNFKKPMPRNAVVSNKYLWPNKVVLYRTAKEFSRYQVDVIEKAMSQIARKTCLQFRKAPALATAYVHIKTNYNGGCNSAVGFQGREQLVSLEAGCVRIGTVIHEMLHAIGLYHEQSASDRDNYVRIRLENVLAGKEHNFVKYPAGYVSNYGVGYDYDSIMHYGSKAFSKNGLNTIEPLQAGTVRIGQRKYLSEKDARKIRNMYGC